MSLDAVISWLITYKYLVIFPLVIVEGPVIMMVSGFFLRLGHFDFWPLYIVLMAGDLTADVAWYYAGYHGARRLVGKYGKFFSITEDLLTKTEQVFHRHHNKILFFSKITTGFGFAPAVLMTAGMARVPFGKYITFNTLGQFIWTGLLMGIGYFFGSFYLVVDEGLRVASVIAFAVIVFGGFYGLTKYFRSRDIQNKL